MRPKVLEIAYVPMPSHPVDPIRDVRPSFDCLADSL